MRIGVTLPHMGPSATPDAVAQGAQQAERLGYDSVWVMDRLLSPVNPRNPYPGNPDRPWPSYFKQVLDPIESLTFAAAQTSRIALGTSILDIPFYNPVVLARRLTTLDVLSAGRLRVGFGLGFSDDEFEAVGASARERGRRADEFVQLLKAIWTTDPVEFQGTYFQLAPSVIGLKPVQRPHPPIYLAAFVPAALRRAATLANGWMPNGIPFADLPGMLAQFREMAATAGRDPSTLEVVVVASLHLSSQPLGTDRAPFSGSLEQLKEDIAEARELGASDLLFELDLAPATDDILATMERLRDLV